MAANVTPIFTRHICAGRQNPSDLAEVTGLEIPVQWPADSAIIFEPRPA